RSRYSYFGTTSTFVGLRSAGSRLILHPERDAFGRTLPVGTGRYLSSSRVVKSATTVRLRRPPHGLSTCAHCYNRFLKGSVPTGNFADPRLTSGAFDFWKLDE